MRFIFRFILTVFLLGFALGFYLFVWRPHSAGTKGSSVPIHATPVAPDIHGGAGTVGGFHMPGSGGGAGASAQPTTTGGSVIQQLAGKVSGATKGAVGGGIKAEMEINAAKQQAADTQHSETLPGAQMASVAVPVAVAGSVTDVINSAVTDENGHATGTIYDVIVDRKSGLATNVIISTSGEGYRGIALTALRFSQVSSQASSGDIQISTTAATLAASPRFTYDQMNADSYISLRSLEGSPVVDDQGKSAAIVNAITYYNNSAQNFVFTVPAPDKAHKNVSFLLPYQAVRIITNAAGKPILQLDHNQTAAMANAVFPDAGK